METGRHIWNNAREIVCEAIGGRVMPTLARYRRIQRAWRAERKQEKRRSNEEMAGYRKARRYRRIAMSEMRPIRILRGIRREFLGKTSDWPIMRMDQDKFNDLMEAALRCLEEAKTMAETAGTINKEVVRTIEKVIENWMDMRGGVITDWAKDAYPVIPRWKWKTMKKRRDLERNEQQQKRVFASAIVKQFPAGLKIEGAFRNEDQVDEREVISCRRTQNELRKGMWSHVKEAMFIGCMMPIESEAYAFARAREHWHYNRNLRLEGMTTEERREVEIRLYQRAEMIKRRES